MSLDINALRAAFSKKAEGGGSNEGGGYWDNFFPFFRMEFEGQTDFRFLQDKNLDNPYSFIVENRYHKLEVNGKTRSVACLNMYGESDCPACRASQEFYNSKDIDMGKKFWRKIDYIAQGLVIKTPLEHKVEPGANPVRLVSLTSNLYKKIENEIVQGDMDDLPFDAEKGYNFRIIKTQKGEYANYDSSSFARKSTPIPAELEGTYERLDLSNHRFPKVEREAMQAMVDAMINGNSYSAKQEERPTPRAETVNEVSNEASTPVTSVSDVINNIKGGASEEPASETKTSGKMTPEQILERMRANKNKAS